MLASTLLLLSLSQVGLLGPAGDAVLLQDDGDDVETNWVPRNFGRLPGFVYTLGAKALVSEDTPYCVLMTDAAAKDLRAGVGARHEGL